MQIALLAYDALPAELRQSLVRLLEAHPRFPEDFLPHVPPDLKSVADRDRWIFAHAATWPDLARGQPAYEHGTWHYVNLPLYLRGGRLVSCAEARAAFPESVRKIAEQQAAEGAPGARVQDSIREALPKALGVLGDVRASAAERALALSWVLHLVGDAHQPLHGVALFTEKRFVTGDRGGNDIIITQRGSLHRLWDGLLGDETSLGAVSRSVARLRATRYPTKPAPSAQDLDLDHWLDEGCEVARSAVYVPAVLNAVQTFERHEGAGKPEVALRKEYVEAAAETARRRASQAGARLARVLSLSALTLAQFSSEPDLRPRP
jgi:hypothetical protein